MRASGRALVLGFLALAPAAASAAPIIPGSPAGSCGALVPDTTLNCSVFALDPFSADPAWEGTFEDPSDVALFSFTFAEAARLTVTTSSYAAGNFDPTLGLFHGDGTILELPDSTPARFFDIDVFAGNWDDHIDLELGPGSYLLALALGNLRESLLAGFDCDFGCDFAGGPAFSFEASASTVDGNGPAPVPEPATLTLVAGGALAGWLQRRRVKRRQNSAVSR
jgi:hypothetical protein